MKKIVDSVLFSKNLDNRFHFEMIYAFRLSENVMLFEAENVWWNWNLKNIAYFFTVLETKIFISKFFFHVSLSIRSFR